MTNFPSLSCDRIVKALQRDGWVTVRQKGSHLRMQKNTSAETLKLTVPAHRPVKGTTLREILKQARLSWENFLRLL